MLEHDARVLEAHVLNRIVRIPPKSRGELTLPVFRGGPIPLELEHRFVTDVMMSNGGVDPFRHLALAWDATVDRVALVERVSDQRRRSISSPKERRPSESFVSTVTIFSVEEGDRRSIRQCAVDGMVTPNGLWSGPLLGVSCVGEQCFFMDWKTGKI